MVIILWVFYFLMTVVYFGIDPDFKTIWPPVGLFICIGLTLLLKVIQNETWMMYVIVFSISGYLFYLVSQYPYLVNYIFILFGIIISSLYQQYGVILFSGFLATVTLVYFYITSFETIFMNIDPFDVVYFILFSVLLVLFFLFHTRFTRSLWVRAQQQEQVVKQKLQSTESYLQAFFSQTKEAIVVYDDQETIIEINNAFCELCVCQRDEVIGQKLSKFLAVDSHVWDKVKVQQHRNRNNQLHYIELSTTPIRNQENKIIAFSTMIRDVTERKKTEEQLIQSEKLKLVGELAAGIAHEIRNPITVLSGFTDLMDNKYYKKIMHSELKRMDSIIDDLLILAKPKAYEESAINPKELLTQVIELYESVFERQKITVSWNRIDHVIIYVDYNRLKQVVINIFKNALEAIDSSGKIELEIIKDSNQVRIVIANNGPSIPKQTLKELGSPFFTTKESGTGLGLMISTTIMKEHGGSFVICNQKDEGVTVTLSLPIK